MTGGEFMAPAGRIGSIERNGARTVYEVHGRAGAPALLFGHAQILSRAQFAPQVRAFADRYRVIALDFRGHGQSPVSPAPYVMEALARDAAAVLDAEGIDRAHYLGSSLGGMVGFALALEHAPRLASVTFLATQGVLPAASGERIRRTAARLAAQGGSMAPAAGEIIARYTTAAWRAEDPAGHARLIEIAAANPVAGYAHSGGAIAAMDYDGRLDAIRTRALVVAGEHDTPTPPERMALYRDSIRGAEMAVIAGAGHFPNWDRAPAFNRIFGDFLERAG